MKAGIYFTCLLIIACSSSSQNISASKIVKSDQLPKLLDKPVEISGELDIGKFGWSITLSDKQNVYLRKSDAVPNSPEWDVALKNSWESQSVVRVVGVLRYRVRLNVPPGKVGSPVPAIYWISLDECEIFKINGDKIIPKPK